MLTLVNRIINFKEKITDFKEIKNTTHGRIIINSKESAFNIFFFYIKRVETEQKCNVQNECLLSYSEFLAKQIYLSKKFKR